MLPQCDSTKTVQKTAASVSTRPGCLCLVRRAAGEVSKFPITHAPLHAHCPAADRPRSQGDDDLPQGGLGKCQGRLATRPLAANARCGTGQHQPCWPLFRVPSSPPGGYHHCVRALEEGPVPKMDRRARPDAVMRNPFWISIGAAYLNYLTSCPSKALV